MKTSIFQNSNRNIVRISDLKFFVASWGFPESFFGLPRDLVSNITNKESYKTPKKLPGNPKKAIKIFRAEILTIFSLLFWLKPGPKLYTPSTLNIDFIQWHTQLNVCAVK